MIVHSGIFGVVVCLFVCLFVWVVWLFFVGCFCVDSLRSFLVS